ncbi:hypothetical protein Agub_g6706 [Astrephomene gubernaculifera]|uniref:Ion transport domain-containing protein n=1 Tax=Astrephomene gubernaculifera TaxID=47775 RepID=A0AAD3DRF9_9CHLO|nr:hypothetical protein Agub_g6706 [Astrephomene gubernaculifera]
MRSTADLESSPRGSETAGPSIAGVNRLRPLAQQQPECEIQPHKEPPDDEDGGSWRAPGYIPSSPHAAIAGPQGIAESTTPRVSVFTHIDTGMARELMAAAPSPTPEPEASQSPMPMSTPHRLPTTATNEASPVATSARAHGHVQFSSNLDGNIPGEIPLTPTQRGTPTSARYAPGLSSVPSGYYAAPLLSSPDRPSRLAGAYRPLGSARTGAFAAGSGLNASQQSWHLRALTPDRVKELKLPLELTVQHSNRIEKIPADKLLPFVIGERPYTIGRTPGSSAVRLVRNCPELSDGSVCYVKSDTMDAAASGLREVFSGTLSSKCPAGVVLKLFVLFPSLMRPPHWLRKDFSLVKTAAVEMSWEIPKRMSFLLRTMRRLRSAEAQYLAVWASKKKIGPGEGFKLYGAEGTAEMTDRPYLLVLKFYEKHEGPDPRLLAASREGPLSPGPLPSMPSAAAAAVAAAAVTPGRGGVSPTNDPVTHFSQPGALVPLSSAPTGGTAGMLGSAALMGSTGGLAANLNLNLNSARRGAARDFMRQLLLSAQSTDAGLMDAFERKRLAWDSLLDHFLHHRDSPALHRLIDSNFANPLLQQQHTVDQVEKVAMANNDPGLLLMLYEHTEVEMDLQVLAFLIHAWAVQPLGGRAATSQAAAAAAAAGRLGTTVCSSLAAEDAGGLAGLADMQEAEGNLAGRIEEFLVKYVVRRRNPLSVTAAILTAVKEEMQKHEENRRVMRLAQARFHSLHLALLRKLNRFADPRSIRQVERILQPSLVPNTVNELSPLQVAFDSQDLKFMTETVIEVYVKVQWAGGELLALTANEDERATGATNPLLAYAVLRSLGFAGKGTFDPLVKAASRLWHLYAFTSTAFFNSPRGRWALHALFELSFLVLYQWQVMYPRVALRTLRALHCLFLAFILGNLLDMAQFVHYKYGSLARIHRFLQDPWNALGLIVNACLLLLTGLKLAQEWGAPWLPPYQSGDAIHMCMATMAVFVWVRALGMAVPVYPSLGPLLNTVARMMEEVIAFLFPMLIVMTGFSTMMSAIYQDLVPDYANFATAMLQLFSSMLGNFDFTLFDGLDVVKHLYGVIVQVIFLVISAILLMNLLIAIITNRYRPQEVEAETAFKKAQIVNYYETQVSRNLVCSPFSLLHLLLSSAGLPAGMRPKVGGSGPTATRLALLPPDGVLLPDDSCERPTGVGEIPHLIFLLTLYPIMAVTCWLLFLVYTPFGVWQFASRQYARYLKGHDRKRKKQQLLRQQQQPQRKYAASKVRSSSPTPTAASNTPITAITNNASASSDSDSDSDTESPPATTSTARRRTSSASRAPTSHPTATTHSNSSTGIAASLETFKPYGRFKKSLQAESQQTELSPLRTAAYMAVTSALTLVGLALYLGLLVGLLLVGWSSLYQWAAKLLFSVFNVMLRPLVDVVRTVRRRRLAKARAWERKELLKRVAAGTAAAAAAASPPRPLPRPRPAFGEVLCSPTGCSSSATPAIGAGVSVVDEAAEAAKQAAEAAEAAEQRRLRALVHWRHAIEKGLAMQDVRYLSVRDVLRALAASKFKPNMQAWQLSLDPRASSQEILDEQLQDLEDDEDEWDDDEPAPEEADNDEMEALILEKTDNLTREMRENFHHHQECFSFLIRQVEQLTADVARVAGSSSGTGTLSGGVGGGGTADGAGGAVMDSARASPGQDSVMPSPANLMAPPPSIVTTAPPSTASGATPPRPAPWGDPSQSGRTLNYNSAGSSRRSATEAEQGRVRQLAMPPRPRPPQLALGGPSVQAVMSARVTSASSGTPVRQGVSRPGSAAAAATAAARARAAASTAAAAAAASQAAAGVVAVGSTPIGYAHHTHGSGGAGVATSAPPPQQQQQQQPRISSSGSDSDIEVGEDPEGGVDLGDGGGADGDQEEAIYDDPTARHMLRNGSEAASSDSDGSGAADAFDDGAGADGGGVPSGGQEELPLLDAAAADGSPTPNAATAAAAAAAAATSSYGHGTDTGTSAGSGGSGLPRRTSSSAGGGLPPLHLSPPPHIHPLLRHSAGADAAPSPALLDVAAAPEQPAATEEVVRSSFPGRPILSPLPGGPARHGLGRSLSGAKLAALGPAAAATAPSSGGSSLRGSAEAAEAQQQQQTVPHGRPSVVREEEEEEEAGDGSGAAAGLGEGRLHG